MPTSWFESTMHSIDSAGMSLWTAKNNAAADSGYQKQLKYQLKAFLHGSRVLRELLPEPSESQAAYVARVTPVLMAVPDTVATVDQEDWLDGIRELLRALKGQ